jgi:phosphoglycerate dehydrogenase-like enzyme
VGPPSILVVQRFTAEQLAQIDEAAQGGFVVATPASSAEEVAAHLDRNCAAEILYTARVPSPWQSQWGIKWIQLHSAGIDTVKVDELPAEITLTTTSGVHSVVLAEHAFALILALRRKLTSILDHQRRAEWPPDRFAEFTSPLLRGNTLGILGYGSIGREVGRIAHALGMIVVAYKRSPTNKRDDGFAIAGVGDPDGSIPREYFGPEHLYDLLSVSDVAVNVLPATRDTERLLDTAAFGAMREGALFVNIGRGKTVDEAALVASLDRGHLGGAALDVFDTEPLPSSSPLWEVDNLIVSPHVGWLFPEHDDICISLFVENIRRYLHGEPLMNVASRKAGY